MNNARDNILARLRANQQHQQSAPATYLPDYGWSREQRIERLCERMTAVRTEVYRLPQDTWVDWLNDELPKRKLNRVLTGSSEQITPFAKQADPSLQLSNYDQAIEDWKADLFNKIDVSITSTLGGIAESGSLILWPTPQEPRLMSLVPPVHVALLQAEDIHETFAQAMQVQQWADNMPTNALLISGPSKTADIEQTLAYGIHGPRQLIVLILE